MANLCYLVLVAKMANAKGGDLMPTNTNKLKARMVECGKTSTEIADLIGISRQSLSLKLNNRYDFRATEIAAICDALKINDVSSYFFCTENSQNG